MKCKMCKSSVPQNVKGEYLNCMQIPFTPKGYKKFESWMRILIQLPEEWPLCNQHKNEFIIENLRNVK